MMTHTLWGLPLMRIIAVVVFAALGPVLMLTAPVVATQYARQLHLGPVQVGQLIAIESLCMSLATLPAYCWQRRFDWRKVAGAAVLLFIMANLVSSQTSNFHLLLILRASSALAGGTLMIISMSTAIDSSQPDRIYGLWVLGQLLLGALGLWLLPMLFNRFGLQSLYVGLALIMLLCLPLVRALSNGNERHQPASGIVARQRGSLPRILLGLIAILMFYLALSAVWTFMETVASQAALSSVFTSRILAMATLLGIAGALCATLIGSTNERRLMIVLGGGLMLVAILMLTGHIGALRFAIAAMLFKFSWTFALPFMLACMASLDRTGSVMNSSNIVIGLGLSMGPALAGEFLQAGLGFTAVIVMSSALMACAITCLCWVERVSPAPGLPIARMSAHVKQRTP